jgi:phage tail-like protein
MAEREDPLVGFHFALDIQGVIKGFFTECSGLGSEHDVIEHKVVNEKGQQMIIMEPARLKWEKVVCKRGITGNMDFWKWRKQVEDGEVEKARHSGSIIMYDQHLKEVARWNFERAWPVKISGPQPKADSNEVGIEELTIAHEGIQRVT